MMNDDEMTEDQTVTPANKQSSVQLNVPHSIGVVVPPGIIDQAIPQEQLDRQEDVEDIVVSDEEEIDEKELYKETPQESPYEKE